MASPVLKYKAAILTISDRSFNGKRLDSTGPALKSILEQNDYIVEYYSIVPDEIDKISKELCYICDSLKLNIVFTNGGTGFSIRDVTPEATLRVIEKNIPGLCEAIRMKSLEKTPHAILSRAISGIRKNTIIVNLPGSPRGAVESLEIILPALSHGIKILSGITTDCRNTAGDK